MRVGYGCCVGSWDKFLRYVEPRIHPERPVLTAHRQTSIAVAYNAILEGFSQYKFDAVILVHDDLEMIDPFTELKVVDALASDDTIGLIGVAGGGSAQSLGWWNVEPIGHQQISTGLIDFGRRTGFVDLLEGSFLAFSPWAIESLRFDEIEGFHGYDEIAMQSLRAGFKNYVADIDTFHHTVTGFKSPESHQEWLRACQRFQEKWGTA